MKSIIFETGSWEKPYFNKPAKNHTVVFEHTALTSSKISAARLDVLPEEPTIREEAELLRSFFTQKHDLETLLADHVLLHMKNVIITPHSAFNTKEAVERILKTTIENISSYIEGQQKNIV
jgi:D-lactate dehydrogenase